MSTLSDRIDEARAHPCRTPDTEDSRATALRDEARRACWLDIPRRDRGER